MVRMELAQGVMDALALAGWQVIWEEEGDADTPTRIRAKNGIGQQAVLIFGCDDQIQLETPGFTESARSALQGLVMHTLQENGAAKAKGKCMDHEPPKDPQQKKARPDAQQEMRKVRRL